MKAINAFWHSHPIELANCMQWNSASWDCLSSSLASRVCFSFFFFRYRHVCFLGESKELFCGMRLHLSWWDLVLLQSSALQHAWLHQGRHSSVLFTTSYCFFLFLRLSTSAHNFLCKFICPKSHCEQDTHLVIWGPSCACFLSSSSRQMWVLIHY